MIDGRRVLGIVPARAGSQGLPGKNLRLLAGRPMTAWTLDAGMASRTLDHLVVSTDDPGVADLSRRAGVQVVDRPAELAGPQASVMDAIAHVLTALAGPWDYVVLLQPTSPLRTEVDIDAAVALCHDRDAPAVIGVSPMLKPAAFYGLTDPDRTFRRATPASGEGVVVNGAIYVGRPDTMLSTRGFVGPGTLAHVMRPECGWDVDTAFDFAICEALWPHVRGG
jgi:CMP-N,N'-diacetyllegionaminic acid synthase